MAFDTIPPPKRHTEQGKTTEPPPIPLEKIPYVLEEHDKNRELFMEENHWFGMRDEIMNQFRNQEPQILLRRTNFITIVTLTDSYGGENYFQKVSMEQNPEMPAFPDEFDKDYTVTIYEVSKQPVRSQPDPDNKNTCYYYGITEVTHNKDLDRWFPVNQANSPPIEMIPQQRPPHLDSTTQPNPSNLGPQDGTPIASGFRKNIK
jgi:hypothetical protein